MSSITTWNRLEPIPRSENLLTGLRAGVADPLWLLARQRQFGEFRAEDAGSPIVAQLHAETGRISRYHAGSPGADATDRSIDYTDAGLPLEALVERESIYDDVGDSGLRVSTGLHFLRLLASERAGNLRATYTNHYAIEPTDFRDDTRATEELKRFSAGRAPDGLRMYEDFRRARGNRNDLLTLPTEPGVSSADEPKVLAAANRFLRWWESFLTEPAGEDDTWVPDRLEHTFAVQADMSDGRVVLVADEYRGGRLDWHSFRAETSANLGASRRRSNSSTVTRTVIPTPVSYGGMPADRFWEMEDNSVRFGDLSTGRTDLARMLLTEFALTYGNDWFVVPIDLPVGSVTRVSSLIVTDTFGETTTVESVNEESGSGWRMFNLSAPGAPRRVRNLLFIPPVLLSTEESESIEEVAFFRDEMANVVWAVERRVQSDSGEVVDQYENYQRGLAAGETQRLLTDTGDAELIYRLQTFVPEHWHPLVPVLAPRLKLELRPLVRTNRDGTVRTVEPAGRILNSADPLRIEEEEIPRDGVIVTRQHQLTRWTDGRTISWIGRKKRVGRGEGSSGLGYDTVENPGNISGR